jgi:DNA-binding NtrC family response regulator
MSGDQFVASSVGVANVAVLVVDDDPLICSVVARVLVRAGTEVRTYPNADAALAALYATSDPIELLLTDVSMPGELDGIAFATLFAARCPEVPIVLMSGDPESLNRGGELLSIRATLAKPFTLAELDQALEHATH